MNSYTPLLEFWFEFASNYSYLSVMRIEREAARHELSVQWRPFLLGPIFQSFGWSTSPFVLQPWMAEFCRQVMQLNFGADRDISSAACVSEVLAQLELPADRIIAEAQAEPNKLRLRVQTELARTKGIFGAPTFFVGEEMFWGNDRLDDALAYAAASGAHR